MTRVFMVLRSQLRRSRNASVIGDLNEETGIVGVFDNVIAARTCLAHQVHQYNLYHREKMVCAEQDFYRTPSLEMFIVEDNVRSLFLK